MSFRVSKVLVVASAIAFIWGSEKRVVAGGAVSELKPPADLSQQVLTELKAINRTVKVPLRNRSIALHVYLPKQVTATAPLVLFASGSGGWHQFDAYVATALAQRGMPVCGINTHAYLKTFYTTSRPATVDELISDYSDIIKEAKKVAEVEDNRPIILSGWSLGAGYAPLLASDPRIKPTVRGVISIAIARDNETALSVSNRLFSRMTGKTFGPSFNVTEYLKGTSPLPVAIIQPGDHRRPAAKQASRLMASANEKAVTTIRLFDVETAGSHSFANGRREFDRALEEALAWINSVQLRTPSGAGNRITSLTLANIN
jgi:type IV secretory pathway VirJ component